MMMIHKVSSGVWGNTDDMRKAADDMEKLEDNLIDIYVEKTGRTVAEIKEKVNAESYFTAEEAVEFGLADEIDETTEVKNTASGGFVMLNGLKVDSRFFANAPKGFIHAEQPKASAVQKEVHKMNLETLKAEHPDLVQAIREEAIAEGATNERARIQAIEDIAVAGHEDLVNAAKFSAVSLKETVEDISGSVVAVIITAVCIGGCGSSLSVRRKIDEGRLGRYSVCVRASSLEQGFYGRGICLHECLLVNGKRVVLSNRNSYL